MEQAEIVGRNGDHWLVASESGRRYFLRDEEIIAPQITAGLTGRLGYVQRAASKVLTFISDAPSHFDG
jgi:hypothetical protein